MESCVKLRPDELKAFIQEVNETYGAHYELGNMKPEEICEAISHVQLPKTDYGIMQDIVRDLSDQLVQLIQSKNRSRSTERAIDALRQLGADESRATHPVPPDDQRFDGLLRRAKIAAEDYRYDHGIPDPPRKRKQSRSSKKATAQRAKSPSTDANKHAKMLAGKVISAYDKGTLKKDGTPLYLSYTTSLVNFVQQNPHVRSLQKVQEALDL